MNDIFILWPTARPKQAIETHAVWYQNAVNKWKLRFWFNTTCDKHLLELPKVNMVLVDGKSDGVCSALYRLSEVVPVENNDIVVVASDDVFPPLNWDVLIDTVLTCKRGMLWVNDGWHGDRQIIAVPICDGGTLQKLSRIIYHPSYKHLWSDNELWQNCKDLDLLVDMRDRITFEHRHYYAGKRRTDEIDAKIMANQEADRQNWLRRSQMHVVERLKI